MSNATTLPLEEILLTPTEAADYLGVTVQTLSVWRCTGRYPLKFVKIGRSVRYRQGDCIDFAQSRTQTQTK